MVRLQNLANTVIPKRKRIWALWFLCSLFIFTLISCGPTKLTITHANLKPKGASAAPILMPQNTTLVTWEQSIRPQLKIALQDAIYGYLPDSASTRILERKILTDTAYNGLGTIEEYTLIATAVFNKNSTDTKPFKMVLVTPNQHKGGNIPVILMESFCPNHNTVLHPLISKPADIEYSCGGSGIMNNVMLYVFGRYIATPPMEMILKHGYGFATIFPSEYVPDRSSSGLQALAALSPEHTQDETRWGAIAAWGWGYSRMIDTLQRDDRFSANIFIPYGHSRYAKAALVAAAYDDRISAVIAHQSGTGGASLNKFKKGESVKEITDVYPHWFSKSYARMAGQEENMEVDQHALLALIAPRPIFLGNARRDVWSDPNGAFRAAQSASSVYQLYNKQGLNQSKLKPFLPTSDISFYIRPGTHGVVKEDWPAFLDFLDAHFK